MAIYDTTAESYYSNGNFYYKAFYNENGTIHNINEPAYVEWFENGNIKWEYYYNNGQYHNTNGPAIKQYSLSGNLILEEYWLNGTIYCQIEEYKQALKLLCLY